MDGGDPGTRRTVRHTDVPSELCLPFEEEADRNKETADLAARRLRLFVVIISICYYSASKKPRRKFKTESNE